MNLCRIGNVARRRDLEIDCVNMSIPESTLTGTLIIIYRRTCNLGLGHCWKRDLQYEHYIFPQTQLGGFTITKSMDHIIEHTE